MYFAFLCLAMMPIKCKPLSTHILTKCRYNQVSLLASKMLIFMALSAHTSKRIKPKAMAQMSSDNSWGYPGKRKTKCEAGLMKTETPSHRPLDADLIKISSKTAIK